MTDCIADEATVDDALQELIRDTSLMEVVCCLDMIATKLGSRIAMFNWGGREYPANGGNLIVPPPDWKLSSVEEVIEVNKEPVLNESAELGDEINEPEDIFNEDGEQAGSQDLPNDNEVIEARFNTGEQPLENETIDNNQGSAGGDCVDG